MLDAATTGTIASLWRFPVKSMQGERLDDVEVTERGLVGDRAFAVIDVETGKVASAKHPRKWRALLDCHARFVEPPRPGADAPPVAIRLPDGTEVTSADADVDDRLSSVFGRPVRLASAISDRPTLEEVWPAVDGLAPDEFIKRTAVASDDPTETVSDIRMGLGAPRGTFFDLATLHVVTTATLATLTRLQPGSRFDARRYRPNIVIDIGGPEAGFVENDWPGATLRLGAETLAPVTILTMRCVMTTMAQADLPADLEILRTLARHNRVELPGLGTWACAGAYATISSGGHIGVGEAVAVER